MTPSTAEHRRRWLSRRSARGLLLVLGLFVLLVLALGALAGVSALLAARELQEAESALRSLDTGAADLVLVERAVGQAQDSVSDAQSRLDALPVRLAAAVPVLGRSFAAERAAAEVSGSTLAGVRAVVQAAPSLRVSGGVDVDALSRLGAQLQPLAARASTDLAALREQPLGLTPGPVREGVGDAEAALAPVVEGLSRGAQGAAVAATVLGGDEPRQVLVALQNNAELQGTGGYVSSVAPGRLVEGRLELEPFQLVEEVNDLPGSTRTVPAPPEYVEDFGVYLADTTLWRTWTMSPDVPDAASVTARVAGELLGTAPDVVVLLDVPALAALVDLGGGQVRLPSGEVVLAENLVEALLVNAYVETGASIEDQLDRRAALAAAAGETVPQLLAEGAQPLDLVRELGRLARGRHFAVWSARPVEQVAFEELDVAGSADPHADDLLLVSANNLNANKLDYYVDRSVSVSVTVGPEEAEVVQRVELVNRAPADLVPYIAGLDTPGIASERIELSVSPRARFTSLRRDDGPAEGDVRTGSERTRVHTFVQLVRERPVSVELRYTVPVEDGHYRLHLLPQPLARDAALEVLVQAAQGWRLDAVTGADREGSRAVRRGLFAERELVEVRVSPAEN